MSCPLCKEPKDYFFFEDKVRIYYRCKICLLIFADKSSWPCPAEEKKRYDQHENRVDDPAYKKFLSRVFLPLKEKLSTSSKGLDFGCGNGPALAKMLEQEGHVMDLYDKYYFDHQKVFQQKYDFIVATEVFEHLFDPGQEISRLVNLLRPRGWLGVMTKLAEDVQAFASWHYKNDPTHVCFFSRKTFEWMASKYDLKLEFFGSDVVLLRT